jgi:hypothetical protein
VSAEGKEKEFLRRMAIVARLGVPALLSAVLVLGPIRSRAEEPPCVSNDLLAAQAALKNLRSALKEVSGGLAQPTGPTVSKAIVWLGAKSASDAAEVRKVLDKMAAFADGVSFRCAVRTDVRIGDVYAYVRPDKSFAIVLGAFFFKAPETGFNSKVGVLAHELSHFALAGATKDTVYGVAAAKELAAKNPTGAQRNAENYEYFIESVVFRL